MLDLLIKNAMVFDGTGSPAFKADIGVEGGKIVMEADGLSAHKIIEAEGKCLCPGFIDAHSHGDLVLGTDYGRLCKTSQGITTEICGQCGTSMFPVIAEHEEELKGVLSVGTFSFPEALHDFTSFKKYAEYADRQKLTTNVKVMVGHGSLRVAVMGFQNRKSEPEELERMKTLLRESMEQGAMGLSSGLIYSPSCYAETEELIELAKVVSEFGGIYATHMRNESFDVVKSVEEALRIGKEANVPVFISHHKACGIANWGLSEKTLRLVEQAKQGGQTITIDQYPYLASMTNINVVVPPKYFADGVEMLGEKAKDPYYRIKMKEEILNPETDFENQYLNCGGWEHIMISSLPKTPQYNGMTFAEAADQRGQDGFDTYFDLLAENHGVGVCIYFSMCDEDLCRIFESPDTVVGTDGICRALDEKAHPRAWGSFPHAINYFCREKNLMPLERVIYKCTLLTAQRTGLDKKGAIKNGWDADLLIFDYNNLYDRAEYKKSNVLCDGIEYVIVGGKVVYFEKKLTGIFPGKLIRHR